MSSNKKSETSNDQSASPTLVVDYASTVPSRYKLVTHTTWPTDEIIPKINALFALRDGWSQHLVEITFHDDDLSDLSFRGSDSSSKSDAKEDDGKVEEVGPESRAALESADKWLEGRLSSGYSGWSHADYWPAIVSMTEIIDTASDGKVFHVDWSAYPTMKSLEEAFLRWTEANSIADRSSAQNTESKA